MSHEDGLGHMRLAEVSRGHVKSTKVIQVQLMSNGIGKGHKRMVGVTEGQQRSHEDGKGPRRSAEVTKGHLS